MAIEIRTAKSAEMAKNAAVVGRMTGGMSFNSGMPDKVDWKVISAMKVARFTVDMGYSLMPKEKGVKLKKLDLDGIYGEMSLPKKTTSDNIIFYIHGGGFVSGSAKATSAYCSMLAKYSGCRVVSINYALSPENVWPHALEDCVKAYFALRRQFPEAKVCLTGESAGGNLVLCTVIRLITLGQKLPECLVPHSPVGDFTASLDRSYYEVKDVTISYEGAVSLHKVYCPGEDLKNPEISPVFYNNFAAFPPTVITCDYNEFLRADCDELYRKLEKAGVDADLIVMKNSFHAFAPIGTGSPETMALMIDNIRFMKKAWGKETV